MRLPVFPFVIQLPSDHRFFGLTYEYNQRVYEQIFDICYYGKGGFNFIDVMQMPVNLRSFYYLRLSKIVQEENDLINNKKEGL